MALYFIARGAILVFLTERSSVFHDNLTTRARYLLLLNCIHYIFIIFLSMSAVAIVAYVEPIALGGLTFGPDCIVGFDGYQFTLA